MNPSLDEAHSVIGDAVEYDSGAVAGDANGSGAGDAGDGNGADEDVVDSKGQEGSSFVTGSVR